MSKSPFKTAIAVANSMIGTSLLVVPVNYATKGIIHNSIAAIIMSVIMGATAVAIGTLVSGRQKEFYKVVSTQLGNNWSRIMAVFTFILPTLIGSIVLLLASSIIFEVFCQFSDGIKDLGEKFFRSIVIIVFIPFCWLNNLQLVVRFGFISMGLIWVYILTITVSFLQNFDTIDSGAFQSQEMSISNIQFWLSVQGFCFICHPSLDAVLKQNKKSQKNKYAVMGGYLISLIIIVGCGVMGALALYKKQSKSKDNIIQYFKGYWQFYVLGSSLSVYLFSIFPIFPVVARHQLFQVLPSRFKQNAAKTHRMLKIIFICIFTVLCLIFIWLSVSPVLVMGFLSSIACFYICYLLPMLIKIKLIMKTNKIELLQLSQSLIDSNSYIKSETSQDKTLLPKQQRSTRNFMLVVYGLILCFGTVLIFGQIWFLISNLINSNSTIL